MGNRPHEAREEHEAHHEHERRAGRDRQQPELREPDPPRTPVVAGLAAGNPVFVLWGTRTPAGGAAAGEVLDSSEGAIQ